MIEKHDVPLDPPLAHELVDFWTYIWNEPPDVPIDVFLGSESEHNDLSVFFERGSVGMTSTCMLVSPRAMPTISDLGAVATHPDLRNRGLSTRVCGTAVDLAFQNGCEALFVGTGGGAAARVYERLGFRKLPGANWWIAVASGEPPEAFVVDYFRRPAASVTVRPAFARRQAADDPADRVPAPLAGPRRQRRDLLDRLRQRRLLHPLHALHQDRDRRGRLLVHRRHRRRAGRRSGHRAPGRPRRVAGGRLHAVVGSPTPGRI